MNGPDVEQIDDLLGPCACGKPWSHPDHDMDTPSMIGPVTMSIKYDIVGVIPRDIPFEKEWTWTNLDPAAMQSMAIHTIPPHASVVGNVLNVAKTTSRWLSSKPCRR